MVRPPVVMLFPAASFARTVNVAVAPETTVPTDVDTVDCAVLTGPDVTVIVGRVDAPRLPPIVALIVFAFPARTPVKVAVYVPSPWSLVAPIVPVLVPGPLVLNTTVAPPAVRLFPAPSLAWSVSVAVEPEA